MTRKSAGQFDQFMYNRKDNDDNVYNAQILGFWQTQAIMPVVLMQHATNEMKSETVCSVQNSAHLFCKLVLPKLFYYIFKHYYPEC